MNLDRVLAQAEVRGEEWLCLSLVTGVSRSRASEIAALSECASTTRVPRESGDSSPCPVGSSLGIYAGLP